METFINNNNNKNIRIIYVEIPIYILFFANVCVWLFSHIHAIVRGRDRIRLYCDDRRTSAAIAHTLGSV